MTRPDWAVLSSVIRAQIKTGAQRPPFSYSSRPSRGDVSEVRQRREGAGELVLFERRAVEEDLLVGAVETELRAQLVMAGPRQREADGGLVDARLDVHPGVNVLVLDE